MCLKCWVWIIVSHGSVKHWNKGCFGSVCWQSVLAECVGRVCMAECVCKGMFGRVRWQGVYGRVCLVRCDGLYMFGRVRLARCVVRMCLREYVWQSMFGRIF